MATIASETWTGTAGSAWPSQWTDNSAATFTIQANAGRITCALGAAAAAYIPGMATTSIFDITVTVLANNTSGWAGLSMGGWQGDFWAINAYELVLDYTNDTVAILTTDSVGTTNSRVSTPFNLVSATTYNVRFQRSGGVIRGKVWTGIEPATWTVTWNDTANLAAGRCQLAGYAANGAVNFTWDDLTVNNTTGTAYTASPADPLGGTEGVSFVAAASKSVNEFVGATDSVNAGYLVPTSAADVAGMTDVVTLARIEGPPSDLIGIADAPSHTKTLDRVPAEDTIIREQVVAEIGYGEIQDYQFLIETTPRVPFGLGQIVNVSTFDPGTVEIRSQDIASPVGDYRMFGTDRRTPPVWAWTLWTDSYTPEEAMGWVDLLSRVWDDPVRSVAGAVVPLTYSLAGRRRRIYGRPRRFTSVPDRVQFGRVHLAADFALAEDVYYEDDENSAQISMRAGFVANSGLIIPARVPWRFTTGTTPRTEQIRIDGTAATWLTAEIVGPVANPWLSIGELTIGLTGVVAAGQTITLSGRPWDQGVQRSDGAWVPEMLDPRARLSQLRLDPGEYSVTYGGTDNTGSSRCVVTWRNAHRSM